MKKPQPKSWKYVWTVIVLIVASVGMMWWLWLVMGDIDQQRQGGVVNEPTPTPAEQGSRYVEAGKLTSLDNQTIYQSTTLPDNLDPSQVWTVMATGDIIPARGVDYQMRRLGIEYPVAGSGIKELLSSGDLTIANLEAPLLANCPMHMEGFTFCGQAAFGQVLAKAGIDLVSLENNHIGNYGAAGIAETKTVLQAAGIGWSDRQTMHQTTKAGLKIGHLSFNGIAGLSLMDQAILSRIERAKTEVDFLIVSVHWGKEYELVPMPDGGVAADDPLDLGPKMVEAGADLIIGNHPHWVEGVEMYKGKLISYAHGNFIFDQSWSLETSQGVVGKYTFYGRQLVAAEWVPVQIMNQAQPVLLDGQAKERVLDRMKQSTAGILQRR